MNQNPEGMRGSARRAMWHLALSGSLMVTMSVAPLASAAALMSEKEMNDTNGNDLLGAAQDNVSRPDRLEQATARGGLTAAIGLLGTIRPEGFSRRAEYWLRTHQLHGQTARGAAEILIRVVQPGLEAEGSGDLAALTEELRRRARIDLGASGNAQEWERRARELGEQAYRGLLQAEEFRTCPGAPVNAGSEPTLARAYLRGVMRGVRLSLDCHDWAGDGGTEYWKRTAEILAGLAGGAYRIVTDHAEAFHGHLGEDACELLNRAERGLRAATHRFTDETAGIGAGNMRAWMQVAEGIGQDLLSVAGVLDRVANALDRVDNPALTSGLPSDFTVLETAR